MAESENPNPGTEETIITGTSLAIPEQTLPEILYLMPVTTRMVLAWRCQY